MWTPVKLNDGTSFPYGFGWFITDINGHKLIAHGGGLPGCKREGLNACGQQSSVVEVPHRTEHHSVVTFFPFKNDEHPKGVGIFFHMAAIDFTESEKLAEIKSDFFKRPLALSLLFSCPSMEP